MRLVRLWLLVAMIFCSGAVAETGRPNIILVFIDAAIPFMDTAQKEGKPDRKNYYGFKDLPDLAMRKGKWKLLCDFDGGRPELYTIFDDAGEQTNLADKHPELVGELAAAVTAWHATMPR